ncbi:hypothetical protein [Caulobacter mirabilis]|uniref:DUF995 domain-containing protein n=1 Tax=Caulobacter mirabilis TaxID=69666 RepID=A0A2D2AXX9_9CAUL|nr:hypothetical protein [Caulobacter mirabilis]ATQ42870.1 hypothetical protein CSW64_10835 [Caulobacter mirabilis]
MSRPALALLLMLAAGGCAETLSEPPGVYQGIGDWERHRLELGVDGRFRHSWRDAAGTHEERGRWSASSRNGYKVDHDACLYIDLEGYKEPGRSKSDYAQACGLRQAGDDLLIFNDDKQWAYRKL